MSEEKEETGTSIPKEVVQEIYSDALHPTMQAVGSIIALPFQAVDAALSKPKLWVAEQQYNYERTKKLLAEKLKDVPPEKIVPPENYVAVPALQQISYCFDSEELRDMYANLLSVSMQEDKKWKIHPAFVDIIKQLTPDEAKLLKVLPRSIFRYHPIIDVQIEHPNNNGHQQLLSNYSNIAEGVCEYPENICAYLENLDRLKLIKLDSGTHLTNKAPYETLKQSQIIKNITSRPLTDGDTYAFNEGIFSLTSFGLNFVNTCVHEK